MKMTQGMEVTMPNGNDLWNNRHGKPKMVWREGKNWRLLDGKKGVKTKQPQEVKPMTSRQHTTENAGLQPRGD